MAKVRAAVDELVEFIKARLAEDKGAAVAARSDAGEHWEPDNLSIDLADDADVDDACFATHAVARHVARQDPGRTLRAVVAKRAVVDLYTSAVEGHRTAIAAYDKTGSLSDSHEVIKADVRRQTYLDALTAMASEWATHPDYQKEAWAL